MEERAAARVRACLAPANDASVRNEREIGTADPQWGGNRMIVEERIYTMQPGRAAEWLAFYGQHGLPVQQRLLGKLIGFFQSEIGALNQVVHLWSYDSLADREQRRARLNTDPDWQAYL